MVSFLFIFSHTIEIIHQICHKFKLNLLKACPMDWLTHNEFFSVAVSLSLWKRRSGGFENNYSNVRKTNQIDWNKADGKMLFWWNLLAFWAAQ